MSMDRVASAFSSFPSGAVGVLAADVNAPLSLVGLHMSVSIQHGAAQVTVRSEYMNETGKDQRVICVHPLPPAWALQSVGIVYDKKEMISRYAPSNSTSTSTSSAGRDFLWTVATINVPWTIVVGSNILITATYVVVLDTQPLQCKQFSFTIPSDLFPEVVRPKAGALAYNDMYKLPVKRHTQDGVVLEVKATLDVPLRGGAELEIARFHKKLEAEVHYGGDTSFELSYKSSLADHPPRQTLRVWAEVLDTEEPVRLFVESDQANEISSIHKHAVTLCITPSLRQCEPNAELLFLVDSHDPLVSKMFAQSIFLALHGVPASTRVNVLLLRDEGGDLCVFPEGARPVAKLDVEQLSSAISGLLPQRPSAAGVSRLPSAVYAAVTQSAPCGPVAAGYVRQVILLSDFVENSNKTMQMVEMGLGARNVARVHAVGLEFIPTVDAALLEVLARKTNGYYRAATSVSEVSGALVEILAQAIVPTLTSVKVAFYEEGVRLCYNAASLPVIPHGFQQYLYALAPSDIPKLSAYATGKVGNQVVEYMGTYELAAQPQEDQRELHVGDVSGNGARHAAAAVQRIRALCDGPQSTSTDQEKKEIFSLSSELAVPSPCTQLMQTRDGGDEVPVSVQYAQQTKFLLHEIARCKYERLIAHKNEHVLAHRSPPPAPVARLPVPNETPAQFLHALVEDIVESILAPPHPSRLVPLQTLNGSFPLSGQFGAALGISTRKIETGCPGELSLEKWCSLLALTYMLTELVPVTQLAVKAAEKYISLEERNSFSQTASQFLELNRN